MSLFQVTSPKFRAVHVHVEWVCALELGLDLNSISVGVALCRPVAGAVWFVFNLLEPGTKPCHLSEALVGEQAGFCHVPPIS